MALVVDVVRRLGSFALQARFASEGKLTAFFGPSGSGKTSLLNIIAGIVRPDKGSIVFEWQDFGRHQPGHICAQTSTALWLRFSGGAAFPASHSPTKSFVRAMVHAAQRADDRRRTSARSPQYPPPFGATSRRAFGRRKTAGSNRPGIAHVAASSANGRAAGVLGRVVEGRNSAVHRAIAR